MTQIAEVTGTFDGVEEISAEPRESIVNYIQRRDILAVVPTGQMEIAGVPVTTWHMELVGNIIWRSLLLKTL